MTTSTNCTIIVNSCDAYSDTWNLFFAAFKNHWKDCPYPVLLNTQLIKEYNTELSIQIHNFKSDKKKDQWGKRLRNTLEYIKTDFVIMLYDDFVLEKDVNQSVVSDCISWLKENSNISVFYFLQVCGKNIDDNKYSGFERIGDKTDYKLNSAPAVWRREDLLKLVEDNDSPWAWEFFGTHRAHESNSLFYSIKDNKKRPYVYSHERGGAVYRGKWVESVVSPLIEKYNLSLDLSLRGKYIESHTEKRSLAWKMKFFLEGYRMIGIKAFLIGLVIIKRKLGFR